MRAASVDRFIERATSFVRFMEEAGSLALPDRLRRAQAELLGLYREALDLPEVDGGDVVAEPDAVPLADWPGMGDVDGYREVFDPYEHDEPVHASLSDDLRDVYRDVRAGLDMLRRHGDGALSAATWHWRFNFDVHWGNHAIDALRALHRAVRR